MTPSPLYALPALLLAACATAPDPAPPAINPPAAFRVTLPDATAVDPRGWWQQFADPVLTRHIETALASNADLRAAAAVLLEYEAQLAAARGAQLPSVTLTGSAQRGRQLGVTATSYQASAGPSWVLDFWGGLRNGAAAAQADLQGRQEQRAALELVIVGSVVEGYVELLALDERLAIARRTLAGRERNVAVAQARLAAGVVSRIDETQAVSEYQSVVLQVRQLEQAVAQQENALSVLLGRAPGAIERGVSLAGLKTPPVPAGLPSSLLTRRPDIRQASQAVAAASARVGVAVAQRYPSISLTGALGGASTQLSSLFSGPNRTWLFGPTLTMPLFDGGQTAAQVDVARARLEQARIGYEKAVQSAFRDAENALVALDKTRAQQQAQAAQVASLRRYEQLARRRYESGITSSLELLDAQRALLASELGLAQTRSTELKSLVALYQALGGNWVTPAAAPGGG